MIDQLPSQNIPEWEVELVITGPISLPRTRSLVLHVEKGERNPFTTTIKLSKAPHGILCVLIARAFDHENANNAAVYFVGQALDVLCLKVDLPLYINLYRSEVRFASDSVRRVINESEWTNAFTLGREYSLNRGYFSRAISWYRKGLGSEDPIDRVIAFWSALEGISSQYYRPNDRTEQGIINQICDCFDQLWGTTENWRVIPNEPDVINHFYNFRNGFSHGFMRVDIETIKKVVGKLPVYQKLVREFLLEWESKGRVIERERAAS
ncbi:MAG: hypothetical protein ANABAC_1275 [Anaerolineae bacterium]|nr:MAG: hypothetical protein ANABAC_1275 [Anaerolineae bacterium]